MAKFEHKDQKNVAGSKWEMVRWETCGTFLRGKAGANSVLNKDKISVQFPFHHHHRYILFHFTSLLHWGDAISFHHLVPFYHHLLYSTSQISSIKHLLNLIHQGQRIKGSRVKYK